MKDRYPNPGCENVNRDMISNDLIQDTLAYWRAADYLSAAQLYLKDNVLLQEPLCEDHVKDTVAGRWGTAAGQNFVFAHLNYMIRRYDADVLFLAGPDGDGNAYIANDYLDGSYSEIYPDITKDAAGIRKLCCQFSFPGGVSSHCGPGVPGSINEAGESGYSLSHAFGAVFDNPELIAAVFIDESEAQTGPLCASLLGNKYLDPSHDGAVLPILYLDDSGSVFSRMSKEELCSFLLGCGWDVSFVDGSSNEEESRAMFTALHQAASRILEIRKTAPVLPHYPMIVLKASPSWKNPLEGKTTFTSKEDLALLSDWLLGFGPSELFTQKGELLPSLQALAPTGNKRIGMNPHANGGRVRHNLRMPDFRDYALDIGSEHGEVNAQDHTEVFRFVSDIFALNASSENFRVFTTSSSHLPSSPKGEPSGRVMNTALSEHLCEGWLEGYLLSGRHGFFLTQEASSRIIDSMASQHAKWLKSCNELHWREPISSLNLILCPTLWQQKQDRFAYQDPGFLNHIANKKADVVRIYLPPDTNCLLSTMDHCLASQNYINVVVTSNESRPQWLSMEEAIRHCTSGISIWDWASNDRGMEPDIIFACAGETPTLEALAAVSILNRELPQIRIRFINVVDLFKLQPRSEHPHGLSDDEYDMLFTRDRHVIFAFHGYAGLVHELTYRRHNNRLIHVRGYKEEGSVTTPFDMRVQNDIDRFHLVQTALRFLPQLGNKGAYLHQKMNEKLCEHHLFIREHGKDLPEVTDWKWEKPKTPSVPGRTPVAR